MMKDSIPGIDSLSIETVLQRLMKSMCIGERASDLPEGIIYRILSFLSTEDAAKASLLSKTWLQAWSTRPSLYFCQSWFCSNDLEDSDGWFDRDKYGISKQDEKRFVDAVENTLQRHSKHNLPIHRFELDLTLVDRKLDKWINMIVEKGVEELVLSIHRSMSTTTTYTLPEIIFEAKQLKVLKVSGHGFFPKDNEEMASFRLERQVFSKTSIECHKLKSLLLHSVNIDDFTFRCLTSSCLLLEELELSLCNGLDMIQVFSLPRLKVLRLTPIHHQKVYIDETLSLERFSYDGGYCELNNCFDAVALLAYQGLKYLSLRCNDLSDMLLSRLISNLPSLESLSLRYCQLLKVISISSLTLKEFTLEGSMNVIDVKINAQSLHSLNYHGVTIPSMFHPSTLGQLENSCFSLLLTVDIDTSFFVKMRGLLTQLRQPKVSLFFNYGNIISFSTDDLEEVQVLVPKPRISELILSVPSDLFSLTYPMLLDGLLWSCCPETLYVVSNNEKSVEFLTFVYEKLIKKRRSPQCCSNSNRIKCWRHYLKDASVRYMDGEKWILLGPLDWKKLVDESLTLQYHLMLIRFSLNWS